jgi:uncharacterized protein involved in outer membrane biogenesis
VAIWKIRERKKKKWPRRLLVAGIVLAMFTVGGFFVAPSIIKTQLERRAGAALGRTVTVGQMRVNPYTVSVTLEQLDVRLKDGTGSFLGWDRLYVNLDPLASIIGAWTVGEIELDGFHVTAQLKPDGSFNFSDILARLSAPAAAPAVSTKPGRPVHIGSLKVGRARVDFADQSRAQPFTTTLGPLSFGLTDFRTAGAGARGAPYQFEAVTEAGERLSWTGTLNADPVSSAGELRLENILLAKYAPYYAELMQAELSEGKLFLRGRYELNLAEGSRVMKLIDGALQLRDVKLTDRTTRESLVELAALDVSGVHADALTRQAAIESVAFTGGAVRARREKDGTLNLLALLTPTPAAAPSQTAVTAAPAKPPEFMIGEVALRDFSVELTDLAAPRPAQLSLAGIQFSLKKVTLAEGAVMPLALTLNWAPQGTVKVDGTVTLKPELKADLKTEAAALAVLPLSPYLEEFINARITQGSLSLSSGVQVAMVAGAPALTFDGGVMVDKLGLVDGVLNEELAGFGSLALNGLKAVTAPQLAVSLAEITVTAPYARVLVNKDGVLNLARLVKVGGVSPPDSAAGAGLSLYKTPPANATASAVPKIGIGKVVITGGDFTLTDRSLEPNVRMAVSLFGGTIAGLSSENLAKADVDLKAAVDGAGPVSITGKLDPLGAKKFVDLKIDFKNVDLLPLSPYSGKYAGYELARGQLSIDVQARLEGKQLDATSVITLNQFTFGAPVASPAATKLPVRLGVALLKDMDGQIVIDVPMSGSIDDPSLRLGKVVLRVVVNLLTKAAVSPFALLGSMFGGGGDELAYQEFAPGGSDLQAVESKKLETMVKALANRPGLSVALEGGYDGPADTFVLRQQKLVALVRGRIWEERHAVNPNIPPPEQLALTPEEGATMVKKMFDEKFPAGTEFGTPLAQTPATAAAPASANKSLLRRVVDVITFGLFSSDPAQPVEPARAVTVAPPGAAPAGLSAADMASRLAETMVVDDNDLRALAAARAQRVRDYFLNEGKIAADRLFLTQDKGAAKENKGPRVFLSLQ